MTPEHAIQNEIRLWLGQHGYLAFRCNVGSVRTASGGIFNTGLPNGFSDLLVFDSSGHTIFIEVKSATGKQRPDQAKFQAIIESRGFKYIIARSVEDVASSLQGEGL